MKALKFKLLSGLLFLWCVHSPAIDRYVSPSGGHVSPFLDWAGAATNIQDAIDASSDGDVIWVTNGVYATGGKVMSGDLTNRVAMDKPITVSSVNGPFVTVIKGEWDPISTNGPGAVRCVWMSPGATLIGFTVTGGATRASFLPTASTIGGGGIYYAETTSGLFAEVVSCIIITNCANIGGGGAYGAFLRNCAIIGNSVIGGAGVGGGAVGSTLINCSVLLNYSASIGGGVYGSRLTNCIVYFNTRSTGLPSDYVLGSQAYSCSPGLNSASSNIVSDPQLVDPFHLSPASPCRGMGSSLYAAGMDIDGETWLNPPSMGCDEVVESEALGPLEVTVEASQPEVLVGLSLPLTGHIIGKASHLEWSFGDGVVATNLSYFTTYTWTNTGDYTVTFTAFNTDNPGGASTNLLVHVVTLNPPALIPDGFTRSGFQLHFDGQAGATYRLLYATNLAEPITWRTQRSAFSSGGVIQFTDTAPSGDARYYRVLAQ